MNLTKEYFLHATAIHNFINYALYYEKSNWNLPHSWGSDIITLNQGMTKFFGFTNILSNGKKSIAPQLLIQNEEKKWFSIMSWEKVVIFPKKSLMVFVTKTLIGDDNVYPIIPSFGIALPILNNKLLELFNNNDMLVIREFWKDDNNKINIAFTEKIAQIDIEICEDDNMEIKKLKTFHILPVLQHWSNRDES